MTTKIKNFILWTLLATWLVLCIIGTIVAISTKNIGLTAMCFSTFAFIGGVQFGHWAEKRSQQMGNEIRERYSVQSA